MKRFRSGIWMVVLAYWLVLAVLTHWPQLPSAGRGINDKVAHFLAYAVLAGLLSAAMWTWGIGAGRTAVLTLVAVLVYGALDEWTQPLVGRSCELADWIANAAGAVFAVGGISALRWFVGRRRSRVASPAAA